MYVLIFIFVFIYKTYIRLKTKKLIEGVIEDLINGQPLTSIFLKVQAIAFYLKNDRFSLWIKNEIEGGYQTINELPDYRKNTAEVFANITVPYQGMWKNFRIPLDQISDKEIRETLGSVYCYDSIYEIEELAKSENKGNLRSYLPGSAYPTIESILQYGNVQSAWQIISPVTFVTIIESVKSKLVQFFLEMDGQFDDEINFDIMTKKKELDKLVDQFINQGIVATNNAQISITGSTVVAGEKNKIINKDLQNISSLYSQVQEILKTLSHKDDLEDIQLQLDIVNAQLQRKEPKFNILQTAFTTIRDILIGVAGNQATPIITQNISNWLSSF